VFLIVNTSSICFPFTHSVAARTKIIKEWTTLLKDQEVPTVNIQAISGVYTVYGITGWCSAFVQKYNIWNLHIKLFMMEYYASHTGWRAVSW
jgi:hypothetical protein